MITRLWPALLITPPITLILGVMIAAVVTYIMPTQYESSAIIEIRDQSTPLHIPTEIEKLTTSENLKFASRELDLITRWGMSHEESVGEIRRHVQIQQIRESDLIAIRTRHPNREDARDITAAIIRACEFHRDQLNQAEFEKQREALEIALAEQERKVLELRQQVGANSPHEFSADPTDAELLHQQENDVFMQLKTQAATLNRLEPNEPPHQIIVHESPAIAHHAVSPNVRLNLTLGALSGLLLGLPLAFIIMALRHAKQS